MRDTRTTGEKIVQNTVTSSVAVGASRLVSLIFSVALARLLPPELVGEYFLALSFATLLGAFTDLGTNSASVKLIAESLGRNNPSLAAGYFRFFAKSKALLGGACALALLLASDYVALNAFKAPSLAPALKVWAAFVLVKTFFDALYATFGALQRFNYILWGELSNQAFKLLATVALVGLGHSVLGAVYGTLAGMAIATAYLALALNKDFGFLLRGRAARIDVRDTLRFTALSSVMAFAAMAFTNLEALVLGASMPLEQVGFYKIASNIAIIALSSLGFGALFPAMAEAREGKVREVFGKILSYVSIIALPVALGLSAASEDLVAVLYGAQYEAAGGILSVMALLVATETFVGVYNAVFLARGRAGTLGVLTGLGLAAYLAMAVLGMAAYGVLGVAAGTVAGRVLAVALAARAAGKEFHLKADLHRLAKVAASALAMWAVASGVFQYFEDSAVSLAAGVPLGALAYVLSLLLTGALTVEEVKELAKKRASANKQA